MEDLQPLLLSLPTPLLQHTPVIFGARQGLLRAVAGYRVNFY